VWPRWTSRPLPANRPPSSARRAATGRPSTAAPGFSRTGSRSYYLEPRRNLSRPHDRLGRRRYPAEDSQRDCVEHSALWPHIVFCWPWSRCNLLRSTQRPTDGFRAGFVAGLPDSHYIGGLLSAIGIAAWTASFSYNVLAMSGRAVEAAGDVNTLLLDKTGTITLGNRQPPSSLPPRRERRADGQRAQLHPCRMKPRKAVLSSFWPKRSTSCADATWPVFTPSSCPSAPRPA